jgi:type I restriction enzyme, S subunit
MIMKKWNEYRIGELVDLSQGQVINAQTNHLVVKEGLPLLRITDMINKTKIIFIDSEKVPQKNVAKIDDIIYTRTGQVGLVFKNQFGVIHNNCFKVIPKDERLNRKFLYWFLKTNAIYEYVNGVASGSAQPDLPHGSFKSITINLPPVLTQQKIASILSSYDDLIETNKQRIKLLEETARELYKEWFVRMRFPDYKNTKFKQGIPEGWEVVYFRDFIKLNRGFDLSDEKIIEGEYPVVASTSVKAYHKYYKVKAPCVSTGRSGSLGTVQYINKKSWPLNTSLYVKDFKGNSPRFVYYFLQGLNLENFNAGAGVPSLNQNHLHGLKFQLPPKKLQAKFDDFVIPVFEQIETLQQQNTQLRQIRDRLLPRLISGKLQVKETQTKKN